MCLWAWPGAACRDMEQKYIESAVVLVSMQPFEQSTKPGLCGPDFLNSLSAVAQHMETGTDLQKNSIASSWLSGKPDHLFRHLNGS